MRSRFFFAPVGAIVCASGLMSAAGPLDPPPGPVAPSLKTLADVEPRTAINAVNTPGDADSVFKITQPGSYYLTGNVSGVAGKCGIEVVAPRVTLDLNGFTMTGQQGSLDAVRAANTAENIIVRNGVIDDWDGNGVDVIQASPALVERIEASRCSTGVRAGFIAVVRQCRAVSNGFDGISVADVSTVEDCVVYSNLLAGVRGSLGVVIARTTAVGNQVGVVVGAQGVVRETNAINNGDAGISLGDGGRVEDCAASGNGGGGFSAAAQTSFINCTAQQNGITAIRSGFFAGDRATFIDCVSNQNSQHGFQGADSATVRGCAASDNDERGISLNNGGLVVGNLTRNNQSDGIYVNFSCDVRDNNCNGDGAAPGLHGGVRVVGQANRIDSNNVTFADRGLLIDQPGNVIVRNSARGCALNFSIAGGNSDAQTLTPGPGFVATNPWANLSY